MYIFNQAQTFSSTDRIELTSAYHRTTPSHCTSPHPRPTPALSLSFHSPPSINQPARARARLSHFPHLPSKHTIYLDKKKAYMILQRLPPSGRHTLLRRQGQRRSGHNRPRRDPRSRDGVSSDGSATARLWKVRAAGASSCNRSDSERRGSRGQTDRHELRSARRSLLQGDRRSRRARRRCRYYDRVRRRQCRSSLRTRSRRWHRCVPPQNLPSEFRLFSSQNLLKKFPHS
jgi:hypothetical protein